ncbi:MAG: cardiolipin synthase ClsB [Thiobacillaceae bacterium]|jgi:cardiolipin synthase
MSKRSRKGLFSHRSIRFLPGNQLRLLQNGDMFFPALESAIHGAQQEIFMEMYIFLDDVIGNRIGAALHAAAGRGVKVRLMVDAFGSNETPMNFFSKLEETGVSIHIYRPKRGLMHLKRHRLRRLHRKLACIDGTTAFAGGINIQDDLDVPGITQPRFDYAVQIHGPLVDVVREQMASLWRLLEWTRQQSRPEKLLPSIVPVPAGDQRAALVIRDNLFHRRDIERAYLSAIGQARHEIILANAYFIPGRRIRRALIEAARRGVVVILLLQGRVDYWLQHFATLALYGQLLNEGISIYEYQVANIHAKAAVIDSHWATVGSSNLDPFSLVLAREANVVVEDKAFAVELRDSLYRAMEKQSGKVDPKSWERRTSLQKIRDWTAYGIVRILAAIASPRDRIY